MTTTSMELPLSQAEEYLEHLSEQAWSSYTKADYSLEQWHSACLIHIHDGQPTSKSQCKLPVKTPDGALNRNGVHAAAAALAGARGGVNASSEQKASAARSLVRFYHQMDEDPPPSLMARHSYVDDGEEFLSHYGIPGMKWGKRKAARKSASTTTSSSPTRSHADTARLLSDEELQKRIKRLEMEKRFVDLHKQPATVLEKSTGRKFVDRLLVEAGNMAVNIAKKQVQSAIEVRLPPTGKAALKIAEAARLAEIANSGGKKGSSLKSGKKHKKQKRDKGATIWKP